MKPIRFIHTSDVHLDTSFSGSGFPPQLGRRKREAIRATFRRILEEARLNSVDLLLIAGDLFEHDRVTPDTIAFLKLQFEGLSPTRIFISPGNHDPFMHDSPYFQESWPPNVHIFQDETLRTVELCDLDVRVTGFAFNGTRMDADVLREVSQQPKDGLNLLLAHASETGRIPAGKIVHAPFSVEEIAGKGFHYCALGHYHQLRSIKNPLDDTQVWYSGIPEGRGWDEEGPCGYLYCNVDGGRIEVQPRFCNQYPLRTLVIDCEGFATREQIVDCILKESGETFNADTILRVRLQGAPEPDLQLSTAELHERLAGRALEIFWEDETLPAVDFTAIAEERTLRGRFVRALNEKIAAAGSSEERMIFERARLYGVQALLGREVRLR